MTSASFDLAALLAPGTPAPAVKWTGFPKYNFVGGHNDAKQLPVDRLVEAATAVLKREGATLATYGLNSGPQGYRPLRDFLVGKLKSHAGISCSADEILITSGSMQGLDLVNSLLLAKGDTVFVEQESYGGALTKLTKLGVNAIGIPLDAEGLRLDVLKEKLEELKKKGVQAKYIYTIPTVQNPTGAIMGEKRRAELIKLAGEYGVMIFEDECYSDLIWSGERPRSIYAMANGEGVIHIGSFSKSIAPALRVGYIVAQWEIIGRMLGLKQDAAIGDLAEAALFECLDCTGGHRTAASIEIAHRACPGVVDQPEGIAADPGHVWIEHRQRRRGGNRRIDRRASRAQDIDARLRGQRMRARHHAVGG